jgi:hypothetical protein
MTEVFLVDSNSSTNLIQYETGLSALLECESGDYHAAECAVFRRSAHLPIGLVLSFCTGAWSGGGAVVLR